MKTSITFRSESSSGSSVRASLFLFLFLLLLLLLLRHEDEDLFWSRRRRRVARSVVLGRRARRRESRRLGVPIDRDRVVAAKAARRADRSHRAVNAPRQHGNLTVGPRTSDLAPEARPRRRLEFSVVVFDTLRVLLRRLLARALDRRGSVHGSTRVPDPIDLVERGQEGRDRRVATDREVERRDEEGRERETLKQERDPPAQEHQEWTRQS